MRIPRVYGRASDVYTWQNNYLNNSLLEVGRGCEFHAYTGASQTLIGKIIPHPKYAGDARFTRILERVKRL